jgi:hypothetical protein
MSAKSCEEADRLEKGVLAVWKETLGEILCEYGIEEDLEKLWRRGIYRVQDFPFNLNWFIVEKEKMCGDIHQYHVIYKDEMKKRHSDRFYPTWRYSGEEMEAMKSEVMEERKKRKAKQTEKKKRNVDLSEDMQSVMAKCIFTGPLSEQTFQIYPHLCGFGAPGGNLRTIWNLAPHVGKAALVCKTWNRSYKDYLVTGLGQIFEAVCERAVDLALNLCDCDEYSDKRFSLRYTRVVYSAFRGEECLFTMRFTRMGNNERDRHELLAQYAVPEDSVLPNVSPRSPVKIIKLPRVCGISVRVIETAQLAEFQKWRAEQVTALEGWLGEQHAVFQKRLAVEAGTQTK